MTNGILSTCLLALWCAVLSGCGSVRQIPTAPRPDEKGSGIEEWKSCAHLLHPEGSFAISDIEATFDSPQNIPQLLHNLKIAAERGLLLQPSFYDEATLGKFFNGSKVTLTKPNAYLVKGTSAIKARIASDVFPKLAIESASSCTVLKYKANDGSIAEHVSANGFVSIAVGSDPPITLGDVRSAFGPEDQQNTGHGWDADGHIYTSSDEGSLTYQTRGRAGLEDSRMRTLFYFKLERVPVIEDSDVVMRIEMRDMQHRILENR